MSQESSSTESVNISTLTREPIQRESIKPDAPNATTEGTSQTNTTSSAEPLSPSPSELVNLGRPPYITDILKARMAYETFDVKEQLAEIDEFIRDGIEDSRVSYENAFNGIKAYIKTTGDIYQDIESIRDYVRLQSKIRGIIKEKQEFEAKSPEKMNAKELERYLKDHAGRY